MPDPERQTFQFTECAIAPSKAYPGGVIRNRPFLQARLSHNGRGLRCYALVDSGADACAFPLDMGVCLGLISPADPPDTAIGGAGADELPVYYRHVCLEIPGIGGWQVYAAFSEHMNRAKWGILGNDGFFDHVRVQFDLANSQFHVERF